MSVNPAVALRDVSFQYDSASEPLFANLSVTFPIGFTGVVGANGVGKTTLLKIVAGLLKPSSGSVEYSGGQAFVQSALYCEQRTDEPPQGLAEFLEDWDSKAFELRGRLGVQADYAVRWPSLSQGERKRAQIGQALWCAPPLLAIDEPTNHIDAEARLLLLQALQRFRGVGVIVSHDREVLDQLCTRCLWIEPPGAQLYVGGFSKTQEQRGLNRQTAVRGREKAIKEQRALHKELVRRREQASAADAKRSKRGLDPKDSSGRGKIDLAKLTGKDGQAGRLLRQLDGRAARAKSQADAAHVSKEYETGIWLPGTVSKRRFLFIQEAGDIPLGDHRTLGFPALAIAPTDRVAITGSNGIGKSTLIAHIQRQLELPEESFVYLPQEITAERARLLLGTTRQQAKPKLGQLMNIISRLGSRPQRLLETTQPSPGEARKLLLALGITNNPQLIILDEPTNHLDLPSIEALEKALADCPCALLLVSHDHQFLNALNPTHWHLTQTPTGNTTLTIENSK